MAALDPTVRAQPQPGQNIAAEAFHQRHPLAGPHTIATSQEKAYTAATLQTSTSVQLQKDRPDLNFAPGILLIQGGQAISVSGQFYGGIAVAGADTQTDEDCAKHGLSIISSALEFAE